MMEETKVLQTGQGKVMPGYKKTEVGVIPEDWEVTTISNCVESNGLIRGPFGGALKKEFFVSKGYKVYEQKNAIYKSLELGDYFIDRLKFFELSRFQINEGDFIVSCSGTIGRIYLIPKNFQSGVINQALLIIRIDDHKCNKKYFEHYFSSDWFQNKITDSTQGGAMKNMVGMKEFKMSSFPLPPLPEQTAIASALSDMDALIAQTEKLIDKKKAIKQGVMQELLTGRRRLKGFDKSKGYKKTEIGVIPEDWEVSTLGEIVTLMTNGFVGTAKTHYTNLTSGILYIQGYNVLENSFNFNGVKYVTYEFHQRNQKSCLREGDLLTIQTGDVGLTTVVTKDLEGSNCHALIISRYKKDKINSKFISYLFNSPRGRARLKLIETGTTMKHLNVGDMLQFKVFLPSLPEQTIIVSALSDIDNDIRARETKLNKLKLQKQGMMQALLTGKIRLV